MDGGLLVGGGIVTLVGAWPWVTMLVGVVDGGLPVGSGVAMLVGAWSCVTVPVEVVDAGLLVVDGGATSVRVGSPVGSTVFMLLVVLSPVEMYTILHYVYTYGPSILQRCVCACVHVCVTPM